MRILRVAVALGALVAASCGRGEPARTGGAVVDSSAPAPAVELGAAAQLDSGNVAYRAKDYARALGHYRAATERQPRLAAGWFGVYMAQTALGNKAGADSAMAQVQTLDPATAAGHPAAGAAGAGALPPGHPAPLPPGHPAPSAR